MSATTIVTITATYNGTRRSATLTVNPPGSSSGTLTNLAVSPATVAGGSSTQGVRLLSAAAHDRDERRALEQQRRLWPRCRPASRLPAGSQSAVFAISTSSVTGDHAGDDHRDATLARSDRDRDRRRRAAAAAAARRRTLTVIATGRSGERITSSPAGSA